MQRLTKRNIKVINHDTGQQIDFPTFGKEAGEDAYNQVSNQLTSLQAQLESSIASMSEAIVTDKTLTIEDAPADAKATGDAINNLRGAVGSPLVAATAASMIDTNKVYVYTGSETGYTNGNWYYHDGTSWVSGGVYNSVAVDLDSTLTLANKAPDSKVVGDAISSLNEDITNKAPAIIDNVTEEQYTNEVTSEKQVKVIGNTFESESVKLYSKAQLSIDNFNTRSQQGITCTKDGENLLLDGVSTADIPYVWVMSQSSVTEIPERLRGKNVKFKITSDKPCTIPLYGTNNASFKVFVRTKKAGQTGDGTNRLELTTGELSNNRIVLSGDISLASDDEIIYIFFSRLASGASFDNVRIRVILHESDAEILDTEETIDNGEEKTFSIPSGYAVVDTGVHKNVLYGVVDTKEYVDNHIPENAVTLPILQAYMPTLANLSYVTPEMYGAVGDGITDDSLAFQAAINVVSKDISFRAHKTYKLNSGIVINGDGLDIYINSIVFEGTNNAAVTLHGKYNRIDIKRIYGYASNNGCAFRLEGTEDYAFSYNEIYIGVIFTTGNCVEILNTYSNAHGYYNRFRFNQLYSRDANIIYVNCIAHFGENSFWAKHVSNNNGFVYYSEDESYDTTTNRLYEFCMESSSKNGVHGFASLHNCRTAELCGRKTYETPDIGDIYVLTGTRFGKAFNTDIYFSCYNNSGCYTFEECLQKCGEDSLTLGRTLAFDKYFYQTENFDVGPCNKLWPAYYDPINDRQGDYQTRGKIIAYYNHKGFVPYYPTIETINTDTFQTLVSSEKVPTIFVINSDCTIYLDYSYCAVGINKIEIIQKDGHTAEVIAKDGTTVIFDGTNKGDGNYILECVMMPLEELRIPLPDGSEWVRTTAIYGLYTGSNEEWWLRN